MALGILGRPQAVNVSVDPAVLGTDNVQAALEALVAGNPFRGLAYGGQNNAPGQAVTNGFFPLAVTALDSVPVAITADVVDNGDATFTIATAGWYRVIAGLDFINVDLAGGATGVTLFMSFDYVDAISGVESIVRAQDTILADQLAISNSVDLAVTSLAHLAAGTVIDHTVIFISLSTDAGTGTADMTVNLLSLERVAPY